MEVTNAIFDISRYKYFSDYYVETGAAAGASISRALRAGFARIESIELDPQWVTFCKTKFSVNVSNGWVIIHHGKSSDLLGGLINQPSVILLDAHPSGPGTAGHEDVLEKGDLSEFTQDKILDAELEIIVKKQQLEGIKCLVVIDDYGPSYENLIKSWLGPTHDFEVFDELLEGSGARYFKDKIIVATPR